MAKLHVGFCTALFLAMLCFGCSHTQTCRVGLISFGNLEGKTIPEKPDGPILEGRDSAMPFALRYHLSDAARDALRSGGYDTLVDAEVITQSGLLVPSNQIIVRGKALNSRNLK